MKLLFDQNISHRILKILPEIFVGSTTVKSEKLINSSDKAIWEFAKKHECVIVTQDSDFNDLNSLFGFPPKIIWVRTGNLKTEEFAKILTDNSNQIYDFNQDPNYGCFEILALKK